MNVTAYMIAFDDQYQELVFPVDSKDLRAGDLLLLQPGSTVPADCKLLSGQVGVIEQGQDLPIPRVPPQVLKKGGLVESGTAKAYVTPADLEPPYADAP